MHQVPASDSAGIEHSRASIKTHLSPVDQLRSAILELPDWAILELYACLFKKKKRFLEKQLALRMLIS